MTFSQLSAVKNTKKTREDLVEALNERGNREQSLEEESEKRAFVGCMMRRSIMTRRSYTSMRSDCSDGGADDAAQRTPCAPFARSSSTHVWWPSCAAKESGVGPSRTSDPSRRRVGGSGANVTRESI